MSTLNFTSPENYRFAVAVAIWHAVLLLVTLVVRKCFGGFPPSRPYRVFGRHTKPSIFYPLKVALFYVILRLRKHRRPVSASAGYGVKSRSRIEDMDCIQALPEAKPLAVDAIYFNAASADGHYLVAATARRHSNLVQTFVYVKLPDLGLLEIPTLPDTSLSGTKPNSWAAGGLEMQMVRPMEQWKLDYNGPLRIVKENRTVNCTFHLTWNATTTYFDYDTDMDPMATAKAIAQEAWSRQYFDKMKNSHQTHYEQFGQIEGTIDIEGAGQRTITLQGMRDHSYGNYRDWRQFQRYAINFIHCEDGTSIELGIVSMPETMTRLVIGYVFHPDMTVDAMEWTDFELYHHGDNPNDPQPPKQFGFLCRAGGQLFEVQCQVHDSAIFYMGREWDAKLFELFCTYTVNGKKGWGISEWDYRNTGGKPKAN